jgi:TM2 domain-containing membrane protein YozV
LGPSTDSQQPYAPQQSVEVPQESNPYAWQSTPQPPQQPYGAPQQPYGAQAPYDPYATQQAYGAAPQPGFSQGMMYAGQTVSTPVGTLMVSSKSKMAAGLLGIFLGSLGVGSFYRGFVGRGVAQLIVSMFTFGLGSLWGFIEGILVLCSKPGDTYSLDSNGYLLS